MNKKLKISNTKKLKMLLFLKNTLKITNCFMCNFLREEFPEYVRSIDDNCLEEIIPELHKFYPKDTKLHSDYGMSDSCWGTDSHPNDTFGHKPYEEMMYTWNFRKKAVDKAIKLVKSKMVK